MSEESPSTLIGAGYDLIKGQPFNNILTAALLACLIVAAYGIYLSVPIHIRAIQDGYERLEAVHAKESALLRETHTKATGEITASLKEDRDIERKHQKEMLELIIKNKLGSTSSE